MDIKLLHKSSTFSNFNSHKLSLGNWFSSLGLTNSSHNKRKNNFLKNSKSLSEFFIIQFFNLNFYHFLKVFIF
jgi:hypothetical protein